MSSNLVALILGAGPRVGASVAQSLASKGYQIAVVTRNGTGAKTSEGYLSLQADFAEPDSIPALFEKVKAEFKAPPSVVVYNAASLTPPPDEQSVLSIPAERVTIDLNINTVSAHVAAQEAVKAWETLPGDVKKTFIYTGNLLNKSILPMPLFLNLGVGKSASAYLIGTADALYADKGYRFFYAGERKEDGSAASSALDGPAHGTFYASLANHEGNIPWDATFVKGKGYVKFE
ncbi:hypothetical protein N7468_000621 [Penicillium chermesinum]|uniref:Uncharacterized protein n=1 Tax=Penicillium chermesinum TaxID=63820 RepID=A0A9W9TZI6_9EURO|nr:uncharacterized protein N7468_000621 [Penicillium chermesinum]KAJ5249170.1 hypothetical protein N7468_000621 [Penicillium chermesinum]KAJ6151265.1 hypothetical protein N7470_007859 [Penicillium chermesinum]